MSAHDSRQFNWHPNFRIESTLPDTRAIRTNFLVKVFFCTITLIVAAFVLKREYEAHTLQQTINELEQQVQDSISANGSRLEKSQRFRKSALSVKEVQRFFRAPLVVHELMVDLAVTKPEGLKFTRTVLSESVIRVKRDKKSVSEVIFKLVISGEVQDLTVLTQFKRELEESEPLNPVGYAVSIDEVIEQRDADTGIIPFTLTVSFKPVNQNSK